MIKGEVTKNGRTLEYVVEGGVLKCWPKVLPITIKPLKGSKKDSGALRFKIINP